MTRAAYRFESDHFSQRCAERGITQTDPDLLRSELSRAIQMASEGSMIEQQFVEHVMDTQHGSGVWRFRVAEGVFYAIAHAGHIRTVVTQDMLTRFKANRRGQRLTPGRWQYLRDIGLSASEIKQGRPGRPPRHVRLAK